MNDTFLDYITNIMATAILTNDNEETKQLLREEHKKVVNNLLKGEDESE